MSLFKRPKPNLDDAYLQVFGLTEHEMQELGSYNARVSLGIVHTPQYKKNMSALQARYDTATNAAEEKPTH